MNVVATILPVWSSFAESNPGPHRMQHMMYLVPRPPCSQIGVPRSVYLNTTTRIRNAVAILSSLETCFGIHYVSTATEVTTMVSCSLLCIISNRESPVLRTGHDMVLVISWCTLFTSEHIRLSDHPS